MQTFILNGVVRPPCSSRSHYTNERTDNKTTRSVGVATGLRLTSANQIVTTLLLPDSSTDPQVQQTRS
ncbi:MAG: hypothetical protein Fues2KO_20720 [Fuerstiella sp.]